MQPTQIYPDLTPQRVYEVSKVYQDGHIKLSDNGNPNRLYLTKGFLLCDGFEVVSHKELYRRYIANETLKKWKEGKNE